MEVNTDLLQLVRVLVKIVDGLVIAVAEQSEEFFGHFRPRHLRRPLERRPEEDHAAGVIDYLLTLSI